MNKKIILILIILMTLSLNIGKIHSLTTYANGAKSAVLMDASSKQVLISKNEIDRRYPASTTKIMTLILMFEAINNHQLKWSDEITASSYAASMGGSQIYLEENETLSLKDIFKSIAIASANDACVALGEKIAGNNDAFVKMMNDKAKELKLTNTHFQNATGLHDPDHYTCAIDLANMAAYLIKIGDKELFKVTTLYDSYIRENSKKKFWLVNTNKLLKQYNGVDGLKTGYTKEAGYCLVTTCLKNNTRLIGVLMGETEPKVRNQDMCSLLDYGYNNYVSKTLFEKNDIVESVDINENEVGKIDLITRDKISYLKEKSNNKKIITKIVHDKITLPITKNKKIAKLNLYRDEDIIASYNLYSNKNYNKVGFIEKMCRNFLRLI